MGWGQGRNTKVYNQARRTLPRHCQHCGSTERLELDHIINLAAHGADHISNCQWLCHDCHIVKTKAEATQGRARHSPLRLPPRHPADLP